ESFSSLRGHSSGRWSFDPLSKDPPINTKAPRSFERGASGSVSGSVSSAKTSLPRRHTLSERAVHRIVSVRRAPCRLARGLLRRLRRGGGDALGSLGRLRSRRLLLALEQVSDARRRLSGRGS